MKKAYVFVLFPFLVTTALYFSHKDGNGSGLILYGKPNDTLGLTLYTAQLILTILFIFLLRAHKNNIRSRTLTLASITFFVFSLGVPVFINDWIYCRIFCYISTILYAVIVFSVCLLIIAALGLTRLFGYWKKD